MGNLLEPIGHPYSCLLKNFAANSGRNWLLPIWVFLIEFQHQQFYSLSYFPLLVLLKKRNGSVASYTSQQDSSISFGQFLGNAHLCDIITKP